MPSVGLFETDKPLSFPHAPCDCPSKNNLVFDVGMNNGDDSAYYLSLGYDVVAVEANPLLVEAARIRFHNEITSRQLRLEGVGIGDTAGTSVFWINEERSVFSSFDRVRAVRNGMRCHPVEVECVTLDMLLEQYGVPYYLKLDAEGAETACLRSLALFARPDYVSVEAEKLEFLQLLWQLGYRQFAIVDQMRHNSTLPNFTNEALCSRAAKKICSYADRFKNRFGQVQFSRGSSGPFGPDTRARWQTFEEVAYDWLHLRFGYRNRGSLNSSSWYDFHARTTGDLQQSPCSASDVSSFSECYRPL